MAIIRQNDDDKNKDADKKTAAKDDKKDNRSASRVLGAAQNRAAAGDDDYDFSKPHADKDPKFLGGTVAKVTKDGDVVMSDHLTEGEMLRSEHEEGKKYEGRSADL